MIQKTYFGFEGHLSFNLNWQFPTAPFDAKSRILPRSVYTWCVSVHTNIIKCVIFIVIRIMDRIWVHHPFSLLITPSPLAQC